MQSGPRFSVKPFLNRSGSTSYRVTGIGLDGSRIRINFTNEAEATAKASELEGKAIRTVNARSPRLVQTRLTDAELLATEATALALAPGQSLAQVLEAGRRALVNSPVVQEVAPLVTTFLAAVKDEVSPRWHADLNHRIGLFTAAHPKLTTDLFTRGLVRVWVDALTQQGYSANTRSNMRSAVRRFGAWLVERGILKENPAAEIRIGKATQRNESPPTILTPDQADAVAAVIHGPARPLLGWVALCLDCGLRPEMEAPKVRWSEVMLDRAVVQVMGLKRGGSVREVPLPPRAVAWLKEAKAAGDEQPAFYHRYWRGVLVRAVNTWLAEHRPQAKLLVWDEDILRHTYASCHAAMGVPIAQLADRMGNSKETIQTHYRHVISPETARQILQV
jgi:integrase